MFLSFIAKICLDRFNPLLPALNGKVQLRLRGSRQAMATVAMSVVAVFFVCMCNFVYAKNIPVSSMSMLAQEARMGDNLLLASRFVKHAGNLIEQNGLSDWTLECML